MMAVLAGALAALGVPVDDIWWSQLVRLTFLMIIVAGVVVPSYSLYQTISMGLGVWRKHNALSQFTLAAVCAAIAFPIFGYFSVSLWLLLVYPAIAAVYMVAAEVRIHANLDGVGSSMVFPIKTIDLDGKIQDGWRSAVPADEKREVRNQTVLFPIGALVLGSLDWVLHILVDIDLGGLLFSAPSLVPGLLCFVYSYGIAIAFAKRNSFQWWIEMGGNRRSWCQRQYRWMLSLITGSLGAAAIMWAYNFLIVGLETFAPTVMVFALVMPAMSLVMIVITWSNFAIRSDREHYLFFNAVLFVVITVTTFYVLRLAPVTTSIVFVFLWLAVAAASVTMVFRGIHKVNPFGTFWWEKLFSTRAPRVL